MIMSTVESNNIVLGVQLVLAMFDMQKTWVY